MDFKVVILQKFAILHNHLYCSIYWLQADLFFKTVSAISLIFFIELDTNFCFFCSFLFGAFNPVSAITGSVFLRFFSSALEAIYFSNSVPPVTFILRLALLGVLVSLVACGFCFLLSDHWLHTDIPSLKLPGVSLQGAVHTGPHSAKLLSMCPVLLKLVGPPCVLKHMLKYFIEREQSQHLARLSFRDPLDFFLLNSLFTCPTSALLCSLLCAISFLITHPYKFSLCPLSLCLCIPH